MPANTLSNGWDPLTRNTAKDQLLLADGDGSRVRLEHSPKIDFSGQKAPHRLLNAKVDQ